MKFTAGNVWTYVEGSKHEIEWIKLYLTIASKGAEHTAAYQSGRWDGTVKLYDSRRNRIASGMVRTVAKAAQERGIPFELVDVREKPNVPVLPHGAWLRDYQRTAVNAMIPRGRGILMAPTGSGKTSCIAAIVQAIAIRWLILVDTKDLMHQMVAQILRWTGETAGVAGDGVWNPSRITVATLQTLLGGLGAGGRVDALLEQARGLISDEVQCVSSDEFYRVAMATPNAWWRYGVSATPLEREDEKDYRAIEALGPLLHEIPVMDLVERSILARPEILFVEYHQPRMTGTYAEVYEAGITLSEPRNALVARLVGRRDLSPRPSLVFFKAKAHGYRLKDIIEPFAPTELVNGDHQTPRRDGARFRLSKGYTDVLLTSKIFNKGIDIPEVESMVNAAAGASGIDAIQKLGRGMRMSPGKTKVRYWDIYDRGNYTLSAHADKRIQVFRDRGFEVKVIPASAIERYGLTS